MAEFDLTKFVEYIKNNLPQAKTELASVTAEMDKLKAAGETSGQKFVELSQKSDILQRVISGLGAAAGNAVGSIQKFADKMPEVSAAAASVMSPIERFTEGIGKNLWSSIKDSVGVMALFSSTVRTAANPIADTSNVISVITGKLGKFGLALRGLHEAQKNLIAVQDPLRTAFIMSGMGAEAAKDAARDYAQELRATQFASNFAAKDIHDFNITVGADLPKGTKIGGDALKEISSILGTDVVTANTAAMTAFKAFGMTGQQAAQATLKAYRSFNQNQIETVRQLGIMHRAANRMGVSVGLAREQIVSASSHLAIFGQKTGAATNLWTTFMGSLKDTVPIEEVGKMVDQLSAGLARMSVQNRAFVSMMGGMGRGSTALGGALKMELAMRGPEGMERHMQGLTRTLQRFAGGRIISLEQAARNPQLEQQFILQRQMLGQLTGITTTEQQNRVLETLQKVKSGGMSQVEAAGAMKEVLSKGKSLQEQTVTELEKHTRFWQVALGQQTDVPLQNVTSGLAENFESVFGKISKDLADPTRQMLNNTELMGTYIKSTTEGAQQALRNLTGAPGEPLEGATRHGRQRESLRTGWFENIMNFVGTGTALGQIPAVGREAMQPPESAMARVRVPTSERPTGSADFRVLATNVSQGNQVIHRDLQNLIRTTRDGLSTLQEGRTAGEITGVGGGAVAGERTITVRIIGDEEKVLNKMTDEIEGALRGFEDKQRKNTLGIY